MRNRSLLGISSRFRLLSPSVGQVVYALLTRSPLRFTRASSHISPFDLHVLGTPPAFVLSQDQTLHDSLIAHLFALLPRTFVIDSGLYIQTRTLALIHCIVQFSKNRVASCDSYSIPNTWHYCQAFTIFYFVAVPCGLIIIALRLYLVKNILRIFE